MATHPGRTDAASLATRHPSTSARSGEDFDQMPLPPELHPVIMGIGAGHVACVVIIPAGRQIDPTADVSLFIKKIQVIVRHGSPPCATQNLDLDDIIGLGRAPFSAAPHNQFCDINFS